MKSFKSFTEAQDNEISMAQNQLDRSIENAKKLKKKLGKKEKDIPAWIQAKITDTDHNMDAAASYTEEKHPALKRAGVSGFSKPKRTPGHPTKSHIVVVKDGDKVKTIRFGQQGVSTAGAPKKGESDRQKARRKSFKARHAKNIARGKTSAAYWANKEKW